MTNHEQKMFNEAVDTVKALRWQERVITNIRNKLEPLGSSEKIALLREIEKLV